MENRQPARRCFVLFHGLSLRPSTWRQLLQLRLRRARRRCGFGGSRRGALSDRALSPDGAGGRRGAARRRLPPGDFLRSGRRPRACRRGVPAPPGHRSRSGTSRGRQREGAARPRRGAGRRHRLAAAFQRIRRGHQRRGVAYLFRPRLSRRGGEGPAAGRALRADRQPAHVSRSSARLADRGVRAARAAIERIPRHHRQCRARVRAGHAAPGEAAGSGSVGHPIAASRDGWRRQHGRLCEICAADKAPISSPPPTRGRPERRPETPAKDGGSRSPRQGRRARRIVGETQRWARLYGRAAFQ